VSYRVVFREEAEEELAEAKAWYDERRDGLGDEFVGCVEAAIESISRSPEMFAKVHREVRRALVRRFPYGIFFVFQDSRVTVIAVFHAKREPRVWQGRQ
jgi:toxin ParE1/3/4